MRQEAYKLTEAPAEEEEEKSETKMLKRMLNSNAISSAMSHDQVTSPFLFPPSPLPLPPSPLPPHAHHRCFP